MKALALALLFLLSAQASARKRGEDEGLVPQKENWSQLNMEANAIMGELKYQHGDYSGAKETFHDSLSESLRVNAPQSQVMALDLFRTGELLSRKGDFEGARRHFEILIGRYPDTEFARRAQGLLSIFPRSKDRIREEEATPVVSGESPAFYLGRIRSALDASDYNEVVALAREYLERYPAHPQAPEVRLLVGAVYLRDGQAARAAKILRGASQQGPAEVRAKAAYLLGGALLESGDLDGAILSVPDQVPAKGAGKWAALSQVWRAAALDKLGRRGEALKIYKTALESGARSALLAFARAALAADSERAGKTQEALAHLRRAVVEAERYGLDDLAAAAQLSDGHLLYRLRRFAEAADAYGAFARRRPDDPQRTLALYQRGLALKRLDRRVEAVEAFKTLAERHPDSIYAGDANLQLGQLYGQMGQGQRAIEHYRRMAEASPGQGRAESELLVAQVHYNAKRYKEAIPIYKRFLDENPSDARAREVEDLLLTSYWMGDRDNPELLSAIERYPNHAIVGHVRWELAGAAYKRRDYASAARQFERFGLDYPKSSKIPDALFFEGESRLKLGEPEAAATAYRSLMARFPKHKRVPEARQRLASALYQAGDYSASARAYAVMPGADAAFNRAVALQKAGEDGAALGAFESFVKKFPKHLRVPSCWLEIARLREARGRADAADAYLKVPAADPARSFSLFSAGRIREKAGRKADAVKAYSLLMGARPRADANRLRGLLRLAILHELANQPRLALPVYAEVMRSADRSSQDFETARRRVETLTRR